MDWNDKCMKSKLEICLDFSKRSKEMETQPSSPRWRRRRRNKPTKKKKTQESGTKDSQFKEFNLFWSSQHTHTHKIHINAFEMLMRWQNFYNRHLLLESHSVGFSFQLEIFHFKFWMLFVVAFNELDAYGFGCFTYFGISMTWKIKIKKVFLSLQTKLSPHCACVLWMCVFFFFFFHSFRSVLFLTELSMTTRIRLILRYYL